MACDGYACAVSAKRDPSTAVLPSLVRQGLALVSNTVVVRLLRRGGLIEGVVAVDRATGRRRIFRGDRYVLAAGALGSPHLILTSGLEASSPARDWVGQCLIRALTTNTAPEFTLADARRDVEPRRRPIEVFHHPDAVTC